MALGKLSSCVLMAACLFAIADALNYYDRSETFDTSDSEEDDLELDAFMVKVIASFAEKKLDDRLLQESRSMGILESIAVPPNVQCSCKGLTCKCCHQIKFPKVELCARLTYRPKTKTVVVDVTVNGRVVFDKEFPASQPRELCFKLGLVVKACLEFTKFHVTSKIFSGCVGIAIHLVGKKVAMYDLGCFEFKASRYSNPFPFAQNRLEDFQNAVEMNPAMNTEGIYENDQDF